MAKQVEAVVRTLQKRWQFTARSFQYLTHSSKRKWGHGSSPLQIGLRGCKLHLEHNILNILKPTLECPAVTVLHQILTSKRAEIVRSKRRLPQARVEELARQVTPPRGFFRALRAADSPCIIAEVKRASPSKGVLRPHDPAHLWRPEVLAQAYEMGGACALSVLTDVHFFWGHPDALGACREATALPALRKDFIIDPYQVYESRWLGADAILLIARALTPQVLEGCAAAARSLGMDMLIEVHEPHELAGALAITDAIIGVNNRDLNTMQVDLGHSERMRALIPNERFMIAESGISSNDDIVRLQQAGVDGFLIGEVLARHDEPSIELSRIRGA